MLKTMLVSPKLFKATHIDKTIPKKETHALKFGSAIHLALLEPKVFMERYAVEPDVRRSTNIYKEWREAVLANDPHAVIVSQADMDNLKGMIDSVLGHNEASAMLRKGVPERSIYQDIVLESGRVVPGKARPDYLHENGDLIDLKSALDVEFKAFRRQVWEKRYDVSAAYHTEIADLEFGRRDRLFWFIALEKTRPWDVAIYRANDVVMESGTAGWRRALRRYEQCDLTGLWPGKQEAAQDIDLPLYALSE